MKILVISEISDESTGNVIDSLISLGHTVLRINTEDIIQGIFIKFENNDFILKIVIRGETVDLNLFEKVWHRRGGLTFASNLEFSIDVDSEISKPVKYNLFTEELYTLKEFIENYLRNKAPLGGFNQMSSNKLIALKSAMECGLETPSSIVSTQKKDLMTFFNSMNKNCISKGVQDILSFAVENKEYCYTTSKIKEEDIKEMNDSFFPSLLQTNIEKKYELRVFYLNKRFYAMAIFSQSDAQTKIDFRNYNWEKPNRNAPFFLPEIVKQKLIKFMGIMNLKTGSIDLIVTPEQKYVFLEVNPTGQYGMVSIPCGYNLDLEIAKEIVK